MRRVTESAGCAMDMGDAPDVMRLDREVSVKIIEEGRGGVKRFFL